LTTEEVYVFARNPRSFVYVQDYSKTRAWIWVKCCVSTSERNPDHSPDAGTGLLSPIAYALQREILLRRENPYSARVAAATRGFESYALQRGILLRRENPTYWYSAAIAFQV